MIRRHSVQRATPRFLGPQLIEDSPSADDLVTMPSNLCFVHHYDQPYSIRRSQTYLNEGGPASPGPPFLELENAPMKHSYRFSNLCGVVYKNGNVIFTPDGNSLLSPVGNRVTCFDLVG